MRPSSFGVRVAAAPALPLVTWVAGVAEWASPLEQAAATNVVDAKAAVSRVTAKRFMVGIRNLRFGGFSKHQYILGVLAVCIVLVFAFDVWLGTCGFDGCPTAAEIRAFHADEGGRVLD